jgi:hypothetical protein
MRHSMKLSALFVLALVVATGCEGERIMNPDAVKPGHPELEGTAVRVLVDVANGTLRVLTAQSGTASDTGGPNFAILGANEVGVSTSNLTRSAPVNNKVTITFDVALTNRLTSASLVPPTFPPGAVGSTGLLLFPLGVSQVVGANASQIAPSVDWNGNGTAGSGAPRNFFNDYGCPLSATTDCFRWEQYPAPLGPGETTAGQRVGFTAPKTVQSFQALLILAADISSDLPAVAALVVTPPSYVMNNGFPATFSAVAYDALNHPLSWPTITWTSPDLTAVEFQYGSALVGTITGPSVVVHGRKVGQTFFTARSGGVAVVVPLDIQVNTIVLVQPYVQPDSQLVVGEQVQAYASVKDNSGQIVPGFDPTWSTSDPNVATVDPVTGLITAVGAGTCNIIATAAAAAGSIPITVLPKTTGDIAGTMHDLDGQPVQGANIHALGAVGLNTTTAADGSFGFNNLPPGTYGLDWSPSGCVAGGNQTVIVAGQVRAMNIVVDCPPSVSGLLTSVQGTLPAGLTVELTPDVGGPNVVGTVQGDGSYSISGLPSGGYSIFVNHLSFNCTTAGVQSISLTQQATLVKDFTVDCRSVGAVTGTVLDLDGQPVAGATITDGGNNSTTTDGAGNYSLLLAAGLSRIYADKAGVCALSSVPVSVGTGQTINRPFQLDCPFRAIGTVTLLGLLPGWPGSVQVSFTSNSSPSGPPIVAPIQPNGTYQALLLSSASGYSGDLVGVGPVCSMSGWAIGSVFQQGSRTFDFNIDCRTAAVRIVVTDGGLNPNPQPLIGVSVSETPDNVTMISDQFGIASFPALAVFNYFLWTADFDVSPPTQAGCVPGFVAIPLQRGAAYTQTVPLSCSSSGALEGTIRTVLGAPLTNVRVSVGPYTVTTNANGHWGVAGLAPGFQQVLRLDTPSGCAPPVPITAAVIPRMTIPVNETVGCNGF